MAPPATMRSEASQIADILIVGCGPTGLVLALLLGQRGWSVALIDRHLAPYALPRAIAYDHEVARVLDAAGVSAAMAGITGTPGVYQWRNAARELLFELHWNGPGLSGYPQSCVFNQPELERVLNAAVQAMPQISLHRGLEAVALEQDAEGVSLHARSVGEGTVRHFRGRYLIGADGANSFVRAATGATLEDLGFDADWLVVDVRPAHPGVRLPVDDDVMLQSCDPARPTTVVSGGPGRRRWEFMALAGETLAELNRPDRAWALLEPWGVTPANAVLERHAVYHFRGAVADHWHVGNTFLAGDAAHLTPPFAGQGLCAGIRDAAALAWRLDLALSGHPAKRLLASYETERTVHAASWISKAIELGRVICVLDPIAARHRDQALLAARRDPALAPPPLPMPALGDGLVWRSPGSGCLAPGGRVARDGRSGHFDHIVGRGFALIARGADPLSSLSATNRSWWTVMRGISAGFGEGAGTVDLDGAYLRWFDELDVEVALLRPDFYVYGTGKADAADALVAALRQELAAVTSASLHGDPRFERVLQTMNLSQEAQ